MGSAAVGEGAIIGISLDVTSPALSTDPALAKNCFAHPGTLWMFSEAGHCGTKTKLKRDTWSTSQMLNRILMLKQSIET